MIPSALSTARLSACVSLDNSNQIMVTIKKTISSLVKISPQTQNNQTANVSEFQQKLITGALKLVEKKFFDEIFSQKNIQDSDSIKYITVPGIENSLFIRINVLRTKINPQLDEALQNILADQNKKMIFDYVLNKSVKFIKETPIFLKFNDILAVENLEISQIGNSKLLHSAIESSIRIFSDKYSKIYSEAIQNKNWWGV